MQPGARGDGRDHRVAVPASYNKPESLDDIIDHSVGRILDLFDIDTGKVKRWS